MTVIKGRRSDRSYLSGLWRRECFPTLSAQTSDNNLSGQPNTERWSLITAVNYRNVRGSLVFAQPEQGQVCQAWSVLWLLHQLRLVYLGDPALQLLRMFGEKLEFGAVTFRMLPGVVIPDLSWLEEEEKRNNAKLNVKHIHTQSEKIKLEDADVICSSVPEIISLPSCYTALPRMTLMLIPLCEKELTRQPIFNSSAPPSEDVCLFPNT